MKLIVSVLVFAVVLTGCVTTSKTVDNTNTNNSNEPETTILNDEISMSWVFGPDSIEKRAPAKDKIVYHDTPRGLPQPATVDVFGRLSWFNALLETFGLHETLSVEKKEELFHALFSFIPAAPTEDYYRAVAIGEYFNDGLPLILYARVYKPSGKAPKGAKGVLHFTGNFAAFKNSSTGAVEFRPLRGMVIPNINWFSAGMLFSNNLIVKASFLHDSNNERQIRREAGNDINIQNIKLAELYIKDEVKENDSRALEMLDNAYKHVTDTEVRASVRLYTFMYHLYKNNISAAENALAEAAQLSAKQRNPVVKRAVDVEAPVLLRIYKNNRR